MNFLTRLFLKKSKKISSPEADSFSMLREALSEYDVGISPDGMSRTLSSLEMDDIDFLESLQLIEAALGRKIDKKKLEPSTSIEELVALIDAVRAR